jgi:hypothetical protein
MENSGTIVWRNEIVGSVTTIIADMWYLQADWKPNESDVASMFMALASKLKAQDVIKEPLNGIVASLRYDDNSSNDHYVLILSFDNSKIFMRSISDEVAFYVDRQVLEPWHPTDNPALYENELKKELSFFHPLNWKRVRTVAVRKDRDDVLFEVLNGNSQYAVVHLTWRKESSRRFPTTRFYKDWQDVFTNRLLEDHKEWNAGQ